MKLALESICGLQGRFMNMPLRMRMDDRDRNGGWRMAYFAGCPRV